MGKIEIMGLGAGDLEQLPYGVHSRLLAADFVHLRTKEHPVVENLKAAGVQFESFDDIYESKDNFDDVYRQIADQLLEKAKTQNLIYAVPVSYTHLRAHETVLDLVCRLLLEKKNNTHS